MKILVVLALTATAFGASAQPTITRYGEWGGFVTNNEITLLRYTGTNEEVVFPNMLDGKAVTRIRVWDGNNFFDNRVPLVGNRYPGDSIRSVVIQHGIRDIGGNVFNGCINLTNVQIPNSVTNIGFTSDIGEGWFVGTGTFANCISLKTVNLPTSLKLIGPNAFWNNLSLTNLIIPPSVEEIGQGAFASCPILRLTLPPRFAAETSFVGLTGQQATDQLVQGLAASLATNQAFISNLVTAIRAHPNNYGLVSQQQMQIALASQTNIMVTNRATIDAIFSQLMQRYGGWLNWRRR